jgi:putative SOS response-associated peptidase YedK
MGHPASSFFEWRKTGAEPRPKYRLSVKGRGVFGMAGVWSPWMTSEDGAVGGYVFERHDCHERCEREDGGIHDRQPVILEPREYGEWLAESERPPVHLLRILGEEEIVVEPLKVEKKEDLREPKNLGLFEGM